ncbi:TPA: NTP transferase domain-containing protein [Neisseria lactamica]
MNAIILAAGLGSRFKEMTQTVHKALLDICGTPNLERTLSFLREAGISNIAVVTGHLHRQFDYLQEKYGCVLIHNEKYREYNSIYSFSLARDFFNGCYVVDADVVLGRNIFLNRPRHSTYFTVVRARTHNEWLPVSDDTGRVVRIDIGSQPRPSLSGVSYWTAEDCRTILNLLGTYAGAERLENPKLYWDNIPMEHLGKLDIRTELLGSGDIFEMDDQEDYRAILRQLSPLKERQCSDAQGGA